MKKLVIQIILISMLFPVLAQATGTALEEYCKKLLDIKQQELLRLENGEQDVEGYAIYGTKAPAFLITGDEMADQLILTEKQSKSFEK